MKEEFKLLLVKNKGKYFAHKGTLYFGNTSAEYQKDCEVIDLHTIADIVNEYSNLV